MCIRDSSYIALYDAQIVRTDVLPGDKQYSINRTRYSVEDTAGDPAQAYSYEALVAKPDMKLTVIDDTHEYVANSQTRKEIVRRALENAADSGRMDHGGRISIYVPDIKSDIIVSGNSLKHALDRRLQQNAAVTENVGKILQEAVQVNELVPDVYKRQFDEFCPAKRGQCGDYADCVDCVLCTDDGD